MTDEIIKLVLRDRNDENVKVYIDKLVERIDDIDSVVTIVQFKDGSSWAAWSIQKFSDVTFKSAILNRTILMELDKVSI